MGHALHVFTMKLALFNTTAGIVSNFNWHFFISFQKRIIYQENTLEAWNWQLKERRNEKRLYHLKRQTAHCDCILHVVFRSINEEFPHLWHSESIMQLIIFNWLKLLQSAVANEIKYSLTKIIFQFFFF